MEKQTLYVTHQGARIHRDYGAVSVSLEGRSVQKVDPAALDRVMVFGNVQITTQVMALMLQHGVNVSFLSRNGRYRGQLISPESGNVFARLAQHARFSDGAFRLGLATRLIADKLRASQALLRRFARNHPEAQEKLGAAADQVHVQLRRLEQVTDLDHLRGLEGAGAAAYFEGFRHMVRPPFAFESRSRRPAHDSVNALLNLGYTLITQEVAHHLEMAGLDPRIGYFHGIRYGRSSLALDLVEPHRVPVVDRMTLALVNRRVLSPEDFEDHGGRQGVRLRPPALKRYLAHYEATLGGAFEDSGSPRGKIRAQVEGLRRALLENQLEAVGE
jgi:CRISPR-associated protein Cas1